MNGIFGINTALIWLIVLIITVVIEIITTRLIALWIALGSLCAIILSSIKVSFLFQVIIFFAFSLIALNIRFSFLRRIIRNLQNKL